MNQTDTIWQLMRRDPAWRMTHWLTPGVAVICALSHFFGPAEADGDPSIFLVLPIFGLLFAGLGAVFMQSSDTDFQVPLPVTVRQIFLSRMLSMAAMMLLPVIAGVVILTALKDPITADVPLESWTLFVCILLGIQCFAIRRNLPQWMIIILLPAWLFVCAVAGIGDLFNGGAVVAVAARMVCWAIIAAVVWRTWQVLPLSFQDASMEMAAALPVRRAIANRRSGALSWKGWLHIALLTCGWGFIQGFVVVLLGASNPFMLLLLGFQWTAIRTRFRWLLSLPVSPRILICAGALPTLLAICGGYAVNIRRPWTPEPDTRGLTVRTSEESDCKTPNVLPSLEYWIPVRSAKAPPIEAPWGETFQPPVNRVMGIDIYDPYAVGCDNSRRFLEWQFNRATITIYGHSIPLDKKVDFEVERTAISGLRTQLVTIASLMAFSLLSLLIAMSFDWHRTRRLPETVRVVGAAAVPTAFLVWITIGDIDPIQWVSWRLPVNTAAAIAVECAVLALLLIGIDRLFRQLEFTDKPAKGAR